MVRSFAFSLLLAQPGDETRRPRRTGRRTLASSSPTGIGLALRRKMRSGSATTFSSGVSLSTIRRDQTMKSSFLAREVRSSS